VKIEDGPLAGCKGLIRNQETPLSGVLCHTSSPSSLTQTGPSMGKASPILDPSRKRTLSERAEIQHRRRAMFSAR